MKTTFIYNIIICWGDKKNLFLLLLQNLAKANPELFTFAIGLIITFPNNNDYSFSGDNDRVIISIPNLCSR